MVEFYSSWACENLRKCLQIVYLKRQENDTPPSRFDPDAVELERCVHLERRADTDDCLLEISSNSHNIGSLVVVSEARRLEVFKADGGEYIKTITGSRLEGMGEEEEEEEGMKFYTVEVDVGAVAVSSLRIRLASLTGVSHSCWVITCQIGLQERDKSAGVLDSDRFNLKQLDGVKLSDKANDFKKLLESMRQQSGLNMSAVFQTALISGSTSNLSDCPESAVDPLKTLSHLPTMVPCKSASRSDTISNDEVIKAISSMEERILGRIEDMKKDQDQKLNQIITLLESKWSCDN